MPTGLLCWLLGFAVILETTATTAAAAVPASSSNGNRAARSIVVDDGQQAVVEHSMGSLLAKFALRQAAMLFPPFRVASFLVGILPQSVRDHLPIPKFLQPSNDGKLLAKAIAKDALLKLYRLDRRAQTPLGKYLMGEPKPNGYFYYDGAQWVPIVSTFYPMAQPRRVYNYYYPVAQAKGQGAGGDDNVDLYYNPLLRKFYRVPRSTSTDRPNGNSGGGGGGGKNSAAENGRTPEAVKDVQKETRQEVKGGGDRGKESANKKKDGKDKKPIHNNNNNNNNNTSNTNNKNNNNKTDTKKRSDVKQPSTKNAPGVNGKKQQQQQQKQKKKKKRASSEPAKKKRAAAPKRG